MTYVYFKVTAMGKYEGDREEGLASTRHTLNGNSCQAWTMPQS